MNFPQGRMLAGGCIPPLRRRLTALNMKKKPDLKPRRRKTRPATDERKKTSVASVSASFPVVGIGASAGGLEALEQFLGHVPAGSGLAFVIVQHLDPTRKGIMPEPLQRSTGMKVVQVQDRTLVRPNCVYVIPPNKDMSVLHGVLHLLEPAKPHPSLQVLADRLILEQFAPPAVLVNDEGNILYVSGHTGTYLEPAAGKADWNIFVMAREGLRHELSSAFHQALEQEKPVVVHGLQVGTNGGKKHVDIAVRRLDQPEPMRGLVMIVFTDVAAPPETRAPDRPGKTGKKTARHAQIEELERNFQQARMEARSIREEMQVTQEELRSTKEEQQSTNEELQSTNEELATSKEEMQSLNEELQIVNHEPQAKVDELSRSNNDMRNLLNSTDIATLFLDNELQVRRFTTQATKIIKLIPGDVGRPITDLASDLLYPELPADAREVLDKLGFSEKPISARDGRWFSARIMPYRTPDDRIDGVVITFADITAAKNLETQLRKKQAVLEKLLEQQKVKSENGKNDAPPGSG